MACRLLAHVALLVAALGLVGARREDAMMDRAAFVTAATREYGHATAERMAERKFGTPVVSEAALEDTHVAEGLKLLRALGFEIVTFSQKKRAKVTPGIPDQKAYHRRRKLTFWWEAKASWGRQSPAQREFQERCEAVGEYYVLGGYDRLREFLHERGIDA